MSLRSFAARTCAIVLALAGSVPAARAATVLALDFEDAAAAATRGLAGDIRAGEGRAVTRGLALACPPGAGGRLVRVPLPPEAVRGRRVRVEGWVRAEDVSPPPKPWNGVKLMLHVAAPSGELWPQQDLPGGSFGWRRVRFHAVIPPDAVSADVCLGLEQVTGKAWFDDIAVTVADPPPAAGAATGAVYKGHDRPRLRGAMIGPRVDEADLREFGGVWKANHVRWQLIWGGFPHGPADRATEAEYAQWLEGELTRLDRLLPVCAEVGILALIDLHTPPGGRDEASNMPLFREKRLQDAFLRSWETIARRFRGNPAVWGYDLLNEPCEGAGGSDVMDWQELATEAARRVRALDPGHAIIVEPAPWGSPSSLDNLEPIPVTGVVYSVHMYSPHAFTHQGVYDKPVGVSYPGRVEGRDYDIDRLRLDLRPAADYQRAHGVHLYIGEFSAIRWAPDDSAGRYLRDCIAIFEENGWDWAYHAFREWDGWSVEHGPDRNDHKPASEPTDRKRLLLEWFARNARHRRRARRNPSPAPTGSR